MDSHVQQTSSSEREFNPTARIAWLAAPARKAKARWLFSKRQTKWIFWGLVVFLAVVALMIWPVLPVNSPAWPIYWLHDTVVSPITGRIFLRYTPYPELIIASIIMLALFALYARSFAGDMHRLATYRALGSGRYKKILIKWANLRRKDGYLQALTERRFRETFQQWAGEKNAANFNTTLDCGQSALALLAKTSAAGDRKADMALAGVAARLIVMMRLSGKPWPDAGDPIVKTLADDGKDLCQGLLSLFGKTAKSDAGEDKLHSLWERGNLWPKNERSHYWEALCWLAMVHGLRQRDTFLLHHFLTELAEYGFLADSALAQDPDTSDRFSMDPTLWLCLEPEKLELGTGPGSEALLSVRRELMKEARP